MNDDNAILNEAAQRYAEALFELAEDAKALEAIEADIAGMKALLADSEPLRQALKSPLYDSEDKAKALEAIAEKAGFQALTRKFLGAAATNQRAASLQDMIAAFEALAAEKRGAATARVTSAHELGAAELKSLKSALKSAIGRDVEIDAAVDPSLIAGLKIRIGSRLFDSSLRTRLQGLRSAMKEA